MLSSINCFVSGQREHHTCNPPLLLKWHNKKSQEVLFKRSPISLNELSLSLSLALIQTISHQHTNNKMLAACTSELKEPPACPSIRCIRSVCTVQRSPLAVALGMEFCILTGCVRSCLPSCWRFPLCHSATHPVCVVEEGRAQMDERQRKQRKKTK